MTKSVVGDVSTGIASRPDATLPAAARWVEATPKGVSWLGFFYGGNIAGAVVGARVPIVLTSRADNDASRIASCAAGRLLAAAMAQPVAA